MGGIIVGVLVVAGGTVAHAASSLDSPDELSLAGLKIDTKIARATTNKTSALVLATGSVSENGIPVQGAAIVARIWPNSSELSAVPVGGNADVKIIDLAYTDLAGRFSVKLDPRLVPQTHIEPGGYVNAQLWAVHDGHEVPWSFSAVMPDSSRADGSSFLTWTTRALLNQNVSKPVDISFELGTNPNIKQSDDPAGVWISQSGSTAAEERAESQVVDKPTAAVSGGGLAVALSGTTTCWGGSACGWNVVLQQS